MTRLTCLVFVNVQDASPASTGHQRRVAGVEAGGGVVSTRPSTADDVP